MAIFKSCDILIPRVEEFEKWSVIACDQFTSKPEYWDELKEIVGDADSTLNLILPEVYLDENMDESIKKINATMAGYLEKGLFNVYRDSFIYVERTLNSGVVRRGVVGALDLEEYSFLDESDAKIRATEKTVMERIPPREKIRRNASLELPHVMVLCADKEDALLGYLESKKNDLKVAYDFDLNMGGGHVKGWLVEGETKEEFEKIFEKYESDRANGNSSHVVISIGDGNHSLATAKICYENLKKSGTASKENIELARFSMVELGNIFDESQMIESIHRVVKGTDARHLVAAMEKAIGSAENKGTAVKWYSGNESGEVKISVKEGELVIGKLQNFLDEYVSENAGVIDYIHGEEDVLEIAKAPENIGLILPEFNKDKLFSTLSLGKVLPRKTFSMGHAEDKRYYLEARCMMGN